MIDDIDIRSLVSVEADGPVRLQKLGLGIDDLVVAAESWVEREPAVAARLVDLGRTLPSDDTLTAARLAHVDGRIAAENGRLDDADRLFGEAVNGYRDGGADGSAARVRLGQAHVRAMAGDLVGAQAHLSGLLSDCDDMTDSDEVVTIQTRATLNLGIVDDLSGRHEQAANRFAVAGRMAAETGDESVRLHALNNRAHSLAAAGRSGESLAVASRLLDEVDGSAEPSLHAEVLETIGRSLMLAGDLGGAIGSLQSAEEMFVEVGAAEKVTETRTTLAEVYLAADLPDEAERVFDGLLNELAPGRKLHLARALLGRGRSRLSASPDEALADLNASLDVCSETEDRSGQLSALNALAELAISRAQPEEARRLLESARRLVDMEADPAGALAVELVAAEIDPEPALNRISGLLAICDLPPMRAVFTARLGRRSLAAGQVDEAIDHLTTAIDIFERVRASLVDGRHRRTYLMARLEVFEDLVRAYVLTGTDAGLRAALETAEKARARALLDMVQGSIISTAERRGEGDAKRLRGLLADVGALYDRLLGPDGGRGTDTMLAEVDRIESEIDELLIHAPVLELSSASTPVDGIELSSMVRGLGVAVVSYHWFGSQLEAFVLEADDTAIDGMSVRRVALGVDRSAAAATTRRLEAAWSRLRPSMGLESRWAKALLRSGRAAVEAARETLWAPLWLSSTPPQRVVVVPVSGIDSLPFAAIVDHGSEPVELVVSPSISLWVRGELQRSVSREESRSVVLGRGGPGLEHVEIEAAAVASVIGSQADLLVGPDATREAVEAHENPSIVHLAAHGLFRRSNPMFSALRLDAEWMSALDMMTLDLTGSLVVLSACETGRADLLPDAEAFGFVRAALAAGARTFVGSHWLVNDHSTAELMRSFHEQLAAGSPPATALARAQREISRNFEHPYHWSSFTVAGAGFTLDAPSEGSEVGENS